MAFLQQKTSMADNPTSARIGQPVRRKEDLRLVTGQGCYTDDINLPGQVYAVMVRSPHAHARIGTIDIAPAMAAPGVLAVLTGRDLVADGLRPIPHKVWSQHPGPLPGGTPVNLGFAGDGGMRPS